MSKDFLFIIIFLLLAGGVWYWYATRSEVHEPQLNAAVYPLYSGAQWNAPQAATTTNGVGYAIDSQPFTNVNNIAAISSPFTQYYHDKLSTEGWTQDISEEAGGPGAEVSMYRKDGQFIVVSFHTKFNGTPANAPVQCPCDVTLSLMSGTQQGPTRTEQQAAKTYTDPTLGFSLSLPSALATSTSETLWSVDPSYEYTAFGPSRSIAGVKFTIPGDMATGTNLSDDTYLSVEHLPAGQTCDASAFLPDPSTKSMQLQEGAVSYSVASSTDAAVGNRYEELVYARTGTSPCIAVRYFIHYGVIQNYPPGMVKEFDKTALMAQFDQIRRSLRVGQ